MHKFSKNRNMRLQCNYSSLPIDDVMSDYGFLQTVKSVRSFLRYDKNFQNSEHLKWNFEKYHKLLHTETQMMMR